MTDVVHDPLDLDVVDVDARRHAQVVHDLVGHQLHVSSRLAHHHLVAQFIIGLHVLVSHLESAHPADQDHGLSFRAIVELMVDGGRAQSVLRVVNGVRF